MMILFVALDFYHEPLKQIIDWDYSVHATFKFALINTVILLD